MFVRGDGDGEGDTTVLGDLRANVGDTADILKTVGTGESKTLGEMGTNLVQTNINKKVINIFCMV